MAKKKGPKMPGVKDKEQAGRSGASIMAYVDPALLAAFNSFIESQELKPTKTKVLEAALREFLQKKGFWPPPPADDESSS